MGFEDELEQENNGRIFEGLRIWWTRQLGEEEDKFRGFENQNVVVLKMKKKMINFVRFRGVVDEEEEEQ